MSDVLLTKTDLQAKCWRFINHPNYFCCGPHSEDRSWSVGLQYGYESINYSLLGQGNSLEEAVLNALQNPKLKDWESELPQKLRT